MLTKAIYSIVNPWSIKRPNIAVPNAVEKTIKAVVKAFIDPIYFTPYISAQVEEPNTFASPFDMPIKPKNKKAENGISKYIKIIVEINNGIFMKINNFLLVNLSIKKPAIIKVITDKTE